MFGNLQNEIFYFLAVLKFLELREIQKLNNVLDQDILILVHFSNQFILSYLNLLSLIAKYLTIKRKKRYLSHPHQLIQLLHGYR